MKKVFSVIMVTILLAVASLTAVDTARAEEIKITGVISKIELAADGKSAVATVKDEKSGNEIAITVTDDLTLDKFKDKRIVDGDEIRTKYDNESGKNISKMFKKTAGC